MADGDHRVFLDALKGVQVQFWTCPNEAHGHVTWTGNVAACDTCGITSEMTGRLIRAAAAYERERIYAELGNEHFVIFTEDGWTTEHSVECRLSGHMSECEYHTAMARVIGRGAPVAGRWRITGISEGLPDLERTDGEQP